MILARGSTVCTVDAGTAVPIVDIDLNLKDKVGREVTLTIAYANLTTYTGVTALLRWGVEGSAAVKVAAPNAAGVADTALAGTANGTYTKQMHVGGDACEIFFDPTGTGGSVTVLWVISG
jgi:hypothetical protein